MAFTHNTAAVLKKIDKLVIEEVPIREPKDNEVLLRMGSVGICGSDIMYWKNGGRRFVLKEPMIVGHEGSGTVVKVGSKVKKLKVGDRVAIEPGTPDRMCEFCKKGRYNLCPNIVFCATPPDDGNICRFYTHAEDFCFKIPDSMTLDEAALVEPLSVALYACRRGEVTLGSNVLITGAGPVGLMCMLAAKTIGAANVIMTDIDDNRLKMATNLGADLGINVKGREGSDVTNEMTSFLQTKPDVTIECSSSNYSFALGIHSTKPGGCLVAVGRPTVDTVLPLGDAFTDEVDIKGVFRYTNCYPAAIEMISLGRIDVKPMITHHFPLRETLRAFETFVTPEEKAVKVIVRCDQ